jgi:hypothetical protein
MKLGAEPQKVAILGVLLLGLGYVFWQNVLGGGEETATQIPRAPSAAVPAPPNAGGEPPRPSVSKKREARDFRPSLKKRSDEVSPDPMTIDPTLRLDLLAKLQSVTYTGAGRNLFEFSNAAPPPPPDAAKPKTPDPKIYPTMTMLPRPAGPEWPPPAPPPPPPPPQAPPIPLKFYGYSGDLKSARGRRAFFLDGEEIAVAGEGDLIKRRYKVLRINYTSVEMEDTQFPGQKQTLPLTPDPNA